MPRFSENDAVAQLLDNIARLLAIQDADPLRIRAYTDASRAVAMLDEDVRELGALYGRDPSPGSAQMVNARATLLVAQQQSHIIRLLSRAVRLDGVEKALAYGARMRAKNSMYERRDTTRALTAAALAPSPMMTFDWAGAP